MFDTASNNKARIAKARASGEFDRIPYSVAIKRKPKEGNMVWCTPVTWQGAPIKKEIVEFLTIPASELVLPPPKLPSGYSLDWHENWEEVAVRIYTPERVAKLSFDELDNIVRDMTTLEKTIGRRVEWLNIWEDRHDYCRYSCVFGESWDDLRHLLQESFMKLFEQAYPRGKERNIGDRVMAPTLEQALLKMLGDNCTKEVDLLAAKLQSVELEND